MFAHLVASLFGIWLMAAPSVLGYGDPAATVDHVVGPLVASFALIAAWQIARALRWANLVLAGWLIVAPVALGYPGIAAANSIACGLVVGALSLVRGRPRRSIAGGWRSLRARAQARST